MSPSIDDTVEVRREEVRRSERRELLVDDLRAGGRSCTGIEEVL